MFNPIKVQLQNFIIVSQTRVFDKNTAECYKFHFYFLATAVSHSLHSTPFLQITLLPSPHFPLWLLASVHSVAHSQLRRRMKQSILSATPQPPPPHPPGSSALRFYRLYGNETHSSWLHETWFWFCVCTSNNGASFSSTSSKV